MRTSTKIWLLLTIVSNVVLGFYTKPLLEAVYFNNGVSFNLTNQAIVGIVAFVFANIAGGVTFFRFMQTQSYSRQLFFTTAPPTITLTIILYFIITINSNTEPTGVASVVKVALTISSVAPKTATFIWICVTIALYFIYLFVIFALLTKPIKRLEDITKALGKGKTLSDFDLKGGKQFKNIEEYLIQINNNYKDSGRIIRKTNQEYLKFIPKQFLKFLAKKNVLDLQLGNKIKKEVTTLFCDIRNSTVTSSTLSLEENFNFINSYLNLISPIIRKNNGYIDKYLGDGVLAIFTKPESAIECAHQIDREIKIKNASKKRIAEVEIGIAIHTGDVVFGVVGDEERKALTVVSDSVNLAGKMQEINKLFSSTILFSKKTLDNFQNYELDYRYIGTLEFKDKNQIVPLFESLYTYQKKKKEQIMSCKNTFEEAVRAFDRKDYEVAKESFEKVISACKSDEISKIYIELCEKSIPKKVSFS